MLAARGVSLGLGRINLSDLNQLPKANRALLGKMKRDQQRLASEQRAQQARLVVRKHVDSKTLWTACATVIVGTVLMALGLVMTVLGYFDSDLFSPSPALLPANSSSVKQPAADWSDPRQGKPTEMGWARMLLKSMQYVGPVLMGLGMFLHITACVITLESRDRHAQIIQEDSELRRSRRQSSQRGRREQQPVRENGTTAGGVGKDSEGREMAEQARGVQRVRAEVHGPRRTVAASGSRTQPPAVADFSLLTSEGTSSTDAMADYTFPEKQQTRKSREIGGQMDGRPWGRAAEGGQRLREKVEQKQQQKEEREWENAEEGDEGESQRRRHSSPALLHVNRRTPRAPAPLVRVESVAELSLSVASGGPSSRTNSPRKKKALY